MLIMQKNIGVVFLVVVALVGAYFFFTKEKDTQTAKPVSEVETAQPAPSVTIASSAKSVKEFTMTAYYDSTGVWYSMKEMTVKKGDTVRVSVTNTKGKHNFTIDELGIAQELPLDQKVVVEFTAAKAGDFVYYCSMPGHRAKGQWGTLHVTE